MGARNGFLSSLREGKHRDAANFYNERIVPLASANGAHVPYGGFVWEEVINIRTSVENRDGRLPLV